MLYLKGLGTVSKQLVKLTESTSFGLLIEIQYLYSTEVSKRHGTLQVSLDVTARRTQVSYFTFQDRTERFRYISRRKTFENLFEKAADAVRV